MTEATSGSRKKRSFDSSFKLKVIDYALSHSNRAAARHFGVDEKRVREWKKLRDDLQMLPQKKRRMEGGGRKATFGLTKCAPRISKLRGAAFSRKHLVSFANVEKRLISLPVEVG